MKIGSFGDVVFEVSDKRVCTPSGVSPGTQGPL